VKTDGFTVHDASLRSSHKTGELEQNAKVELCYMSDAHDQVRITAVAELVTDRAVRHGIWDTNPLLRSYLGTVGQPGVRALPGGAAPGPVHARVGPDLSRGGLLTGGGGGRPSGSSHIVKRGAQRPAAADGRRPTAVEAGVLSESARVPRQPRLSGAILHCEMQATGRKGIYAGRPAVF